MLPQLLILCHLMWTIIELCLNTTNNGNLNSLHLYKRGWWKHFAAVAWMSPKNRAVVICDDIDWKVKKFLDWTTWCLYSWYKIKGNIIILTAFKWFVNKLTPLWPLACFPQSSTTQCYQQVVFSSSTTCACFRCSIIGLF